MKLVLAAPLCLSLVCIACSGPRTRQVASAEANIQVAADYRPPEFTREGRRDAALAARPALDAIFRGNADASHYVGQIWGVVLDGELVYFDAFGVVDRDLHRPVDADTKFHIASLTKSFTSMAILKLRDAGALSLQDPVTRHLPELASAQRLTGDSPPIVIEHLMTMTSGLPEDNPWADRQLADTTEDLLALIRGGLSFSTVPGSAYEYSNLGYALMGEIITRVSGRPYQQYVTEEILEPLGMLETYWDYRDVPEGELAIGYRWEDETWKREPMLRTGAYGAIGGMITSLHDMARYVGFHLAAWPAHHGADDGPVRRSTVREMHVPRMPRLDAAAKGADGNACPALVGYGYGLGVRTDCHGVTRIAHTGGLPGFGANIQFFPDHGFGVISFANLTYSASSAQHNEANEALFASGVLARRELPVPAPLARRARQVAELVESWLDADSSRADALGAEILADNFYLDRSREHRAREAKEILGAAGAIQSIDEVAPINQLRGTFVMHGSPRSLRVFFTQSPELPARVQRIDLQLL